MTREIFQEIMDITGASSEVLEYPLAFCRKTVGVEEAFSSAPMFKSNDHSIGRLVACNIRSCSTNKVHIEIAYVMKYAYFKSVEEGFDPWGIRQTAVYQKYDTGTNQSTWIFINPITDCAFQKRLATILQNPVQVLAFKRQPLLIHNVLFGTYFPLWRDYLAYYERKVLTIVCVSCRNTNFILD
jgi:hypothetical protein